MTTNLDHVRAVLSAHSAGAEFVMLDDGVPTAQAAAERLGCEVGAIANSLVFMADGDPVLVVASGAHRVDTKRVAAHLGAAKVKRATPEQVLEATGQTVGACAPVGHSRPLPTLVDRWLADQAVVWAGGGHEHAVFATTAAELLRITGGDLVDVGE